MKIKYIGMRSHPGWRGVLPHYKVDCPIHGTVYTYPHGYKQIVDCPFCLVQPTIHRLTSTDLNTSKSRITHKKLVEVNP